MESWRYSISAFLLGIAFHASLGRIWGSSSSNNVALSRVVSPISTTHHTAAAAPFPASLTDGEPADAACDHTASSAADGKPADELCVGASCNGLFPQALHDDFKKERLIFVPTESMLRRSRSGGGGGGMCVCWGG